MKNPVRSFLISTRALEASLQNHTLLFRDVMFLRNYHNSNEKSEKHILKHKFRLQGLPLSREFPPEHPSTLLKSSFPTSLKSAAGIGDRLTLNSTVRRQFESFEPPASSDCSILLTASQRERWVKVDLLE
jgi:hypothetical protein